MRTKTDRSSRFTVIRRWGERRGSIAVRLRVKLPLIWIYVRVCTMVDTWPIGDQTIFVVNVCDGRDSEKPTN